ncbi:hypothetical protein NKJ09_25915 [Mesorhizobium sp. M0189]|uniref:hypothetical protein n=1 Tax=unclassified Mesorhizobium TaxID=325217 RepID=UPI0033351ABB
MTGWQSSASLRVGVSSDFEILDTPVGLAPIRLDGAVVGGAALVIGLHDDDAVSH